MKKFEQMKEAHANIYEIMKETEVLLKDVEANAGMISKNISKLAGVLKIHLSNEDRFLYPKMKENADTKLKRLATQYENEMGELSPVFMAFKDKYNTSSKILSQLDNAEKEIKDVFNKVRKRMDKEDHELYPLAENVMR
ncbi:hemerythrin domain-containing protein [Acidaminobacter sp. JC074]|uniref:hemerythrin domain-containing protein n=1 Tax=Acidaminobacter sp. JC074 TaxID=2530199 RepID=UPI001F100710|nr:hemerythrin domain-containing protein [Acidaminobacter sp. JC074]